MNDNIKKSLPDILGDRYDLIAENRVAELSSGRHQITDGIYVNIEEYDTYARNERRFECHKKYVDVQYIISGTEKIIVQSCCDFDGALQWDYEKDIAFMDDNGKGEEIILNRGEYICLMPGDFHMPCVKAANAHEKVRKAVFKIPYSLFKKISCLVMDVDGTLTDGKVYMGAAGEQIKAFNIKDGLGINELLPCKGIEPIIITGRSSKIVEMRCQELHITEVYQGVKNKAELLKKIAADKNIGLAQFAYIGDDTNDCECMKLIKEMGGLIGCPSDSSAQVLALADYVSGRSGGDGAVREFIEWL